MLNQAAHLPAQVRKQSSSVTTPALHQASELGATSPDVAREVLIQRDEDQLDARGWFNSWSRRPKMDEAFLKWDPLAATLKRTRGQLDLDSCEQGPRESSI